MHKTLTLLDCIREQDDRRYAAHERLALAKALVFGISNLQFGPEVGVGPQKADAPVVATWLVGIATSLSYELAGIGLFRTQMATATREQLREEVVVLPWPA